jgi:hypothetical protein
MQVNMVRQILLFNHSLMLVRIQQLKIKMVKLHQNLHGKKNIQELLPVLKNYPPHPQHREEMNPPILKGLPYFFLLLELIYPLQLHPPNFYQRMGLQQQKI